MPLLTDFRVNMSERFGDICGQSETFDVKCISACIISMVVRMESVDKKSESMTAEEVRVKHYQVK